MIPVDARTKHKVLQSPMKYANKGRNMYPTAKPPTLKVPVTTRFFVQIISAAGKNGALHDYSYCPSSS